MRPGTRALALLVTVRAVAFASPPPTIPWQEAGSHVGHLVTVEGDVIAAHRSSEALIVEFAIDDPHAFRVVLLIPLLSSLPREPERLYLGKRVQASGKVQRFEGRPEMVLRSPDQLLIVDVGGVPRPAEVAAPAPVAPPAAVPPAPSPPATVPRAATPPAAPPSVPSTPTMPPRAAVPPAAAPAAEAPVAAAPATIPSPAPAAPSAPPPDVAASAPATSPARGLAEAVQAQVARLDPCARARERWQDAAAALKGRSADLTRCLDALGYRCRPEAGAVAPALATLEWAEQQVEVSCP